MSVSRIQRIDTSMEKIKGNLANVQSVLIDYATREHFLANCLQCAERAAQNGDTESVLRSLDAMRESLGMARTSFPEDNEATWTTAEILAHAG